MTTAHKTPNYIIELLPIDALITHAKALQEEREELEHRLVEQQAVINSAEIISETCFYDCEDGYFQIYACDLEKLQNILSCREEEGRKESMVETKRLNWMSSNEAFVAWNREGEACRVFARTDEDFEPVCGWTTFFDSARAAIDAAMLSAAPKTQG